LFVLTLIWPDWIELAFRVDPDDGGGSLEWAVAGAALAASLAFAARARLEWRRTLASHA